MHVSVPLSVHDCVCVPVWACVCVCVPVGGFDGRELAGQSSAWPELGGKVLAGGAGEPGSVL